MDDASASQQGLGLTLSFDETARAVLARNSATAGAAPIDEGWLRAALAEHGWGELRVLPDAVAELLTRYHAGQAFEALRVAEAVDASLSVTLSDDHMLAQLTLVPAEGGTPVSSESVLARLNELGVQHGVDHAVLAEALAAGQAENLIVARGRAPEDGKDGALEPCQSQARSRSPRVSENGQVDYRDLGDIVVVHPGDALMRRVAPTAGTPGRTLTGDTLAAQAGKAVMFGMDLPGTRLSADDPDLLVAAITGQPVMRPDGMSVEPVLAIESVDMASGNIRFEGSVKIKGDVGAGMSVTATGDIEVGGVVELATLEAGGSVAVRGGIIGGLGRKDGKRSGAPCVRAAVNVEAGYAQNAHIEAGDCIVIEDTAVQCELIAANHIVVGRKHRGCLIGGHHQATLSLTAKEVGSPQRIATVIEIGVNPAMHRQMLELAKARDAKETQLLDVSKLLALARQQPGRLPEATVDKARQTAAAIAAAIADLREQFEELNRKVGLAMGARVIATTKLHEAVEVRLGERHFRVPREYEACAIGLDRDGTLGLLAVDEEAWH
ncbi:FapA family protein [Niveibacterium umoris]|uniref:Flagellar Assembly Protein A N-terminal region domain-containing protein n=1 Tax=Niveibacterium umoris TaxID=1193620 RepID=A0A840BQS4_9RHOO|nr:FapA family protein [Niveibacterium umoris]MBB4013819.1 hypothetical protein [Niveibacterium umoris]